MNELLNPFLRKFVVIFFDYILVYSLSLYAHLGHLQKVLIVLAHNKFHLYKHKCLFAKDELQYLGHVVSTTSVAPDPTQINTMMDWPILLSTTDLRGFFWVLLGYTGASSAITHPLLGHYLNC